MSPFIQDFWTFDGQVGATDPQIPPAWCISANADDKFPDKMNRNMEQILPGGCPWALILEGDTAAPPTRPRVCYSQGSFLPCSPLL